MVFGFKSHSLDRRKLTHTLCCDLWLPAVDSVLDGDVARCCWCQSCQAGHWALEPRVKGDSHACVTPCVFICIDPTIMRLIIMTVA